MKQVLSILLIVLISFPLMIKNYLLFDFQLNREAIEEEFCENKDKPELECHGSCHMSKEIQKVESIVQESNKKEKSPAPLKIDDKKEIYIFDLNELIPNNLFSKNFIFTSSKITNLYYYSFYNEIFHPPKLS